MADDDDVDDLQEDEGFISASSSHTNLPCTESLKQVVDADTAILEEDEAFLQPATTTTATDMNVDEELEEDPAFAMPPSTAFEALYPNPSSSQGGDLDLPSSPSRYRAPRDVYGQQSPQVGKDDKNVETARHAHNEEDEDSLPSATQFIRKLTGNKFDVSNLNLGVQLDRSQPVQGTSYNGRRILFQRQKGNGMVGDFSIDNRSSSGKDSKELGKLALDLLETPIHTLMKRVEDDILAKKKKAEEGSTTEEDKELKMERGGKGKGKTSKSNDSQTWTDKYKPKQFTELLGDEVCEVFACQTPSLNCL